MKPDKNETIKELLKMAGDAGLFDGEGPDNDPRMAAIRRKVAEVMEEIEEGKRAKKSGVPREVPAQAQPAKSGPSVERLSKSVHEYRFPTRGGRR